MTGTENKAPEKRWYVIHTYSGYENKVEADLDHRIESMGMEDKNLSRSSCPIEDEIEDPARARAAPGPGNLLQGYVLVGVTWTPTAGSWSATRRA